jgi:hypothetical protein
MRLASQSLPGVVYLDLYGCLLRNLLHRDLDLGHSLGVGLATLPTGAQGDLPAGIGDAVAIVRDPLSDGVVGPPDHYEPSVVDDAGQLVAGGQGSHFGSGDDRTRKPKMGIRITCIVCWLCYMVGNVL